MIKILILSLLLFYVFRTVARFLTLPARMNHENQKQSQNEKDISEKGRIIKD